MAFSYVCPTEVISFNNVMDEFTENGASIVFVSTDSKHSLHQWQSRPLIEGGLGNINIPLLSDQNHKMSKAYGVLLEDEGVSLRGMFIINPDGIVKHISINDTAVGRSVLETLRLLQAFRAEADDGVYCAANWNPGEATIVPTNEGALSYFRSRFGVLSTVSSPGGLETKPVSKPPSTGKASSAIVIPTSPRDRDFIIFSPSTSRPLSVADMRSPTKKFAKGALQKVFGESRASSPLPSPLDGVGGMERLNERNLGWWRACEQA
ncbi:thioredoxin-like protein [Patellaria atrata CBS 101060]|uniref:Thioredoxin-like protein n=1 Tax=Patellaria atrata CBS 101060 TaxID=1346257 RepID=A0A9P4SJA7_9PEZI|nr:thioredoxin-like protein [Patellaria atrata CBS 101060]